MTIFCVFLHLGHKKDDDLFALFLTNAVVVCPGWTYTQDSHFFLYVIILVSCFVITHPEIATAITGLLNILFLSMPSILGSCIKLFLTLFYFLLHKQTAYHL